MATYKVALSGNDASSGNTTQPFKTIHRAMQVIAEGDLLYLTAETHMVNATAHIPALCKVIGIGNAAHVDAANGNFAIFKIMGSNTEIKGIHFHNNSGPDQDNETAPAAILIDADGTTIDNTLIRFGSFSDVGIGVKADNGAGNTVINRNSFANVDYTAIMFRDGCHHNSVLNNTLLNIGFRYNEGGAINIYASPYNNIRYNHIENCAQHGIDQQNFEAPESGGNIIDWNYIKDAMQVGEDGGAIYAFKRPLYPDIWRNNYIENCGDPSDPVKISWGIYLDDLFGQCTVNRNFIIGGKSGIMIHGGSDNTIVNNIIKPELGDPEWPGNYGIQVQSTDDGDLSANVSIRNNVVVGTLAGQVGATDPVVPTFFRINEYVIPGDQTFGYDWEPIGNWFAMGGDVGTVIHATYELALANSGITVYPVGNYGPT